MGLIFFNKKKKSRYGNAPPSDNNAVNNLVLSGNSDAVDFFNLPSNSAGIAVTESTSMRVAAVYGCVEKISVISTLPKHIYRRTESGSVRVDNDIWPLLNTQPSDNWTASSMWERIIQSMLLRGNGFAKINRVIDGVGVSRSGRIKSITPLMPNNVTIVVSPDGKTGYNVIDPITAKTELVRPEDMLHFPGFGFDGYRGMSVIQYAAHSGIGIALAADQYSSEFFANGQRPDYILTSPGSISKEQKAELKDALENSHGGLGNRHKPIILSGGLDVKPLSLSSADAQLLQTREFEVINICIAFGVPPQLIGAKESVSGWAGSSLEQLNLGFAKYTLKPHISRIEQELNRKLFPGSQKNFIKFNLDAFLEGDSRTQAEYFQKALGGPGAQGFMSVNEVRKLKNLEPDTNPLFDSVIVSNKQQTPAGNDNESTTDQAVNQ